LPEYQYPLSISDFGPDVSSKVLGEVGEPFRFQVEKQVLKLAGWDLNAEPSGKSPDGVRPVIPEKGKAHLRYVLYKAAMIASTKSQHFVVYLPISFGGRRGSPESRRRCG
jgi:hypothetical protein